MQPLSRAVLEVRALQAVLKAGMLHPGPPQQTIGAVKALRRYGPLGGGATVAALQHAKRTAVVDDHSALTFAELDARSNAAANALRDLGVCDGVTAGVLCRNHAGALIATFACAKAGVRAVYFNTGFAAPQLAEVAAREDVRAFLVDDDLAHLTEGLHLPGGRHRTWYDDGRAPLTELVRAGADAPPPAPRRTSAIVMLTSGTTGTPKGAPREQPRSMVIPGALLHGIPFRRRDTTVLGAPLFHGTGFALAALNLSLGSTLVLRRHFDPAQCLQDLQDHRADALVLVPIMLQRLLSLGEEAIRGADLERLRIVFCAGSQLTGDLAHRAMDLLGDVVYNLYGSTEVSYATIASPRDLRAAPGTAGPPALGARVAVLDQDGRPVPPGTTGRIFVGNASAFGGYTDGRTKEQVDGLLSTGDVGHFDAAGRLFIDGRDDEMIVSGGENVFPHEVEETLSAHPDVVDAAVVGVEDEEFGQRLRAFVVAAPDTAVTAEALQAHVKGQLARYKVPRDVVFVDELPRNPSGKVLKRELLQRA